MKTPTVRYSTPHSTVNKMQRYKQVFVKYFKQNYLSAYSTYTQTSNFNL